MAPTTKSKHGPKTIMQFVLSDATDYESWAAPLRAIAKHQIKPGKSIEDFLLRHHSNAKSIQAEDRKESEAGERRQKAKAEETAAKRDATWWKHERLAAVKKLNNARERRNQLKDACRLAFEEDLMLPAPKKPKQGVQGRKKKAKATGNQGRAAPAAASICCASTTS